jgi:hypothetical protein
MSEPQKRIIEHKKVLINMTQEWDIYSDGSISPVNITNRWIKDLSNTKKVIKPKIKTTLAINNIKEM